MKLRRFEIRWASILGRALLPEGMFGAAVDAIDLGEAFRRECAGPPWYAALVLRLSLWMAWLSPIWLGRRSAGGVHRRRLATFGALDRDAREAMLEAMLSSPRYVVRATAFYFKLTACLALLGDERVFRRIGAYEHGRLPMLEERT